MTPSLHWWSSLSWSAAAAIAILAFSIGVCLWIVTINCLRATLGGNRRAIPPRRHGEPFWTDYRAERASDGEPSPPWPIVDYAARYREKSEWLGDEALMARPANRITERSHQVGKVIRFERPMRS